LKDILVVAEKNDIKHSFAEKIALEVQDCVNKELKRWTENKWYTIGAFKRRKFCVRLFDVWEKFRRRSGRIFLVSSAAFCESSIWLFVIPALVDFLLFYYNIRL